MAPGSFATIQHRLPTHRSPTEVMGTTVQWEQTRPRRQKDQEQVKKQARNHGGLCAGRYDKLHGGPFLACPCPGRAARGTIHPIPPHSRLEPTVSHVDEWGASKN